MSVATGLSLHREGLMTADSDEDTSDRLSGSFAKNAATNSDEVSSNPESKPKNGQTVANGNNEDSQQPQSAGPITDINDQADIASSTGGVNEDTTSVTSPKAPPSNAPSVTGESAIPNEAPENATEDVGLYYKTITSQKKIPGDRMKIAVRDPPPTAPEPGRKTRQTNQIEFLKKVVNKSLWANKQSWPFQKPVDAVLLELPTYYELIKEPMDLGTIRKRLSNNYYYSASQCIADVRQMFANCFLFNPPGDDVAKMGLQLQEIFDRKLRDMPGEEVEISGKSHGSSGARSSVSSSKHLHAQQTIPPAPSSLIPPSPAHEASRGSSPIPSSLKEPPSPAASESQKPVVHRVVTEDAKPEPIPEACDTPQNFTSTSVSSTSLPTAVPSVTTSSAVRPSLFASARKKRRTSTLLPRPGSSASQDPQFEKRRELCLQVLDEILDPAHREFASPFYRPVDVALEPEYPKVVRRPIDLGTIKKRVENGRYSSAHDFVYDVRLMFTNCYRYNPPGHLIAEWGHKLQAVFETQVALLLHAMLEDEAEEGVRSTGQAMGTAGVAGGSKDAKRRSGSFDTNKKSSLDKVKEQDRDTSTPRKHLKAESSKKDKDEYDSSAGPKKARVSVSPAKSGKIPKSQREKGAEVTPVPATPLATADTNAFAMLQQQILMLQQQIVNMNQQDKMPVVSTPIAPVALSGLESSGGTGVSPPKKPRKKREPKPEGSGRGRGAPKSPVAGGPPRKAGRPPGSGSGQLPGWKTATSAPDKTDSASRQGAGSPSGAFDDADADAGVRPMSYDEKRQLSQDINKLPPDNLAHVVDILAQHEPQFGGGGTEEIEIDFEALRPKTLRELEKFVHGVLSGATKRPAPASAKPAVPKPAETPSQPASKPTAPASAPAAASSKPGGVPVGGKPGAMRAPAAKRLSESSSDSSTDSSSDSDSDDEGGDSSSAGSTKKKAPAKKPTVPGPTSKKPPLASGPPSSQRPGQQGSDSKPASALSGTPAARPKPPPTPLATDATKKPAGPSPGLGWSAPTGSNTSSRPAPVATAGLPPQLTGGADPFDSFRKQAAEKEERERLKEASSAKTVTSLPRVGMPPMLADESSGSSGSSSSFGGGNPAPQSSKPAESSASMRERLKEEERKRRLALANSVDLTSQHELMRNFESAEWQASQSKPGSGTAPPTKR